MEKECVPKTGRGMSKQAGHPKFETKTQTQIGSAC